eukprot:1681413-Prorocentrum_lima.AAC.1
MTSSLVGSEMCIRDSVSTPSPARCPSRPEVPTLEPACKFALSVAFVTVSYTHLTLPTICSV